MIKTRGANGSAKVKLTLDPAVGAERAAVCGDWNGWSPDADVMKRDAKGGFNTTVELEAGRSYRFRYLLDGERWENDWSADAYLPNEFGEDDSLIDLTVLEKIPDPAIKRAPAKAAAAKTEPAAKPAAKAATATKATTSATKAAPAKRAAKKKDA